MLNKIKQWLGIQHVQETHRLWCVSCRDHTLSVLEPDVIEIVTSKGSRLRRSGRCLTCKGTVSTFVAA
jgi:hypothetical protein